MRLTLISEDNTVIIDGVSQVFDYSDLIDSAIWAVQWDNTFGEIEYRDPATYNEAITSISVFQPIINRYASNQQTVDTAVQNGLDNILITYLDGTQTNQTIAEAATNKITFTAMSQADGIISKKVEVQLDSDVIVDELFNTNDKNIQANTRTMVGYKWGLLNFNQARTGAQDDELAIYTSLLDFITSHDDEVTAMRRDLDATTRLEELNNYVISFTAIPVELLDETNPTVQTIRQH